MSGIYVSTGAFSKEWLLVQMAEACEAMGAGLELSSGMPWSPTLEWEIESLAARKSPVLVHNYFPPPREPFVLNLAAANRQTLERSRQHVRTAIDLSARLGAPFYSVHSGFAIELKAEHLGNPEEQAQMKAIPYEYACADFQVSLRGLAAYGRGQRVRLLIENNVLAREQTGGPSPLLMTEPGEIAQFLRKLEDASIGLLLDAGHAKVTANALGIEPASYFEELAPWIGALHLSDNDGIRDTNRPFGEDAWFAKYCTGDVPVVIESYGVGAEGAAKMVDVVKRWTGAK